MQQKSPALCDIRHALCFIGEFLLAHTAALGSRLARLCRFSLSVGLACLVLLHQNAEGYCFEAMNMKYKNQLFLELPACCRL